MAISMEKYVDIKSGTNNIQTATEKDMIARIFTSSEDLEDDVVECSSLKEVSDIFGTESDEYKVAQIYFNFVNKYQRSPKKISFGKDNRSASITIEDVLDKSYETSNNFATFAFISTLSAQDITDIAEWTRDNHPNEFLFVAQVTSANYATISANVANIDGVSLELVDSTTGKYNFVIPMAITATTDYNKENGTQNYMYQQIDGVAVMVDDDTTAENLDKKLVNYYGRTQQAGQKIAFYQNGVCQGDYQDQSIYINEVWLKDALVTKFINYFLVTPNWYANKAGQGLGNAIAFEVINRAKINGTITTEKELSDTDKVYIYNLTNDENAWRQVYMEGFYFTSSIDKETINNQVTYKFNYLLVYSKGDSIKKVEGRNILI